MLSTFCALQLYETGPCWRRVEIWGSVSVTFLQWSHVQIPNSQLVFVHPHNKWDRSLTALKSAVRQLAVFPPRSEYNSESPMTPSSRYLVDFVLISSILSSSSSSTEKSAENKLFVKYKLLLACSDDKEKKKVVTFLVTNFCSAKRFVQQ